MKKYVVHRDIYVNSLIYLESVVPVPMIRENNKKFLEISEFKNVIVILLFC